MNPLVKRLHRQPIRVGAVRELPSGEIAISKTQRNVHVFFEALALPAAGIMGYMAYTQKQLPDWQRGFLGITAAATVIVDGGLLISYARRKP